MRTDHHLLHFTMIGREIRAVLTEVYRALKEKGYNPINQLVGTSSRKIPPISLLIRAPAP